MTPSTKQLILNLYKMRLESELPRVLAIPNPDGDMWVGIDYNGYSFDINMWVNDDTNELTATAYLVQGNNTDTSEYIQLSLPREVVMT